MRSFCLFLLTIVFITPTWAQETVTEDKPKDAGSYAVGVEIGRNLKRAGFQAADFSTADLLAGIVDMLSDKKSRLTDKEAEAGIEKINKILLDRAAKAKVETLAKGRAFLEENKKRDGVVTLPSGLQYEVLTEGKGKQPKLSSEVKVHYEGKLINEKIFDSSIKRGEPIEFPVSGVIKGWTEALQRMRVGDKWKLFIPSELAYGENGAGEDIGPNEVLIFEVELLDVKDQ